MHVQPIILWSFRRQDSVNDSVSYLAPLVGSPFVMSMKRGISQPDKGRPHHCLLEKLQHTARNQLASRFEVKTSVPTSALWSTHGSMTSLSVTSLIMDDWSQIPLKSNPPRALVPLGEAFIFNVYLKVSARNKFLLFWHQIMWMPGIATCQKAPW